TSRCQRSSNDSANHPGYNQRVRPRLGSDREKPPVSSEVAAARWMGEALGAATVRERGGLAPLPDGRGSEQGWAASEESTVSSAHVSVLLQALLDQLLTHLALHLDGAPLRVDLEVSYHVYQRC